MRVNPRPWYSAVFEQHRLATRFRLCRHKARGTRKDRPIRTPDTVSASGLPARTKPFADNRPAISDLVTDSKLLTVTAKDVLSHTSGLPIGRANLLFSTSAQEQDGNTPEKDIYCFSARWRRSPVCVLTNLCVSRFSSHWKWPRMTMSGTSD